MLSPTIRAAAAQFATSQLSTTTVKAVELGYLTGYAAGYVAQKPERFPLAGDQAFKRLLGAYLGENITVYHPHSGRYGLLRGLPACYEGQQEPLADVEFYADAEAQAEGCGDLTEPVSKILPVLYGFEDLAPGLFRTPSDCTPALKALLEYAFGCEVDKVEYVYTEPADRSNTLNRIYLQFLVDGERRDASFWSNGTALIANLEEQCLDWLRQHHFAVGLRPEQYHRRVVGVDYANGGKPQPKIGCPVCVCDGPGCAGKEVPHA